MLVGNLEFRFPLLRPFTGVSQRMYGPLPAEVGAFVDAGVAWNQRRTAVAFLVETGTAVASTGVLLRVNLFGFAVAQFDFARPLQRAGRGWEFQFNFSPGSRHICDLRFAIGRFARHQAVGDRRWADLASITRRVHATSAGLGREGQILRWRLRLTAAGSRPAPNRLIAKSPNRQMMCYPFIRLNG